MATGFSGYTGELFLLIFPLFPQIWMWKTVAFSPFSEKSMKNEE
jgi:hypothetical protein